VGARRCSLHWCRLFLRTLVGLLRGAGWELYRRGHFVCFQSMARTATDQSPWIGQSNVAVVGESGRTRRLENNFPQPTASSFSNQPAELSLWPHSDSLRSIHALGYGRSSAGAFL